MSSMKKSALKQYNAVQNSIGFFHLSDRGKILVTGPDRTVFLHSMFSNEVKKLPEWEGRYGTFLTARGKMISDFFYYKLPSSIVVDIRKDLLKKTSDTLKKFIVMDELQLKDISNQKDHFSLQGPESERFFKALFKSQVPSFECEMVEFMWQEVPLWGIRKNDLSELGFEVIVPWNISSSFREFVLEKGRSWGLVEVDFEVRNLLRMEAGIPWYGVDMDESRYPMEARLEKAISFTKGCYIGQEVVAKATHVGGVRNLLIRLKVHGHRTPKEKCPVYINERKIGFITSAVFSISLGCPIAFAYLRRSFAHTGKFCQIEICEGKTVSAEIVENFTSTIT